MIDALALTLRAGEVVGVFGPSGAGKSTLFRAIAGDLAIARGTITLFGADATRWPLWRRARRGLGYVPQTPSVLADLTVDENLAAFAALSPAFSRARGGELLEALDLKSRGRIKAAALSGGERRKLELVRALGARPKLLVCDEPFAALDPAGRVKAGGLLRAAADEGAAVLLADHDVREALPLCDRALLLLSGAVACEKKPDDFAKEPLVIAHYVALS